MAPKASILLATLLLIARSGPLGGPGELAWAAPNEGEPSSAQAKASALAQDRFGRRLIPEVLRLKDGERIPPDVYRKYDSRLIAESLVHRMERARDSVSARERAQNGIVRELTFDARAHAEVQLHFHEHAAAGALEYGILVQHQTGFSGGGSVYAPIARAKAEDAMSGLQIGQDPNPEISSFAHALLPRYGTVDLDRPVDIGRLSGSGEYGKVILVLDKESHRRVTYSAGDSLGLAREANMKVYTQTLSGGRLTVPKDNFVYEAQVWGEVDVRDAQEFRVIEPIAPSVLKQLRATGLPVYSSQEIEEHGRTRQTRGRLLIPADPALRKRHLAEWEARRTRRAQGGFPEWALRQAVIQRSVEWINAASASPDPLERKAAAKAFPHIADARLLESVLRATHDPQPDIQSYAITALGQYREERVLGRLSEIMAGPEIRERLCGLLALGDLDHPRAFQLIEAATRDPNPVVSRAAAGAKDRALARARSAPCLAKASELISEPPTR